MISTWMLAALAGAVATETPVANNWHADYGVALAETKQEDHPLLVVLDVPSDESQQLDAALLDAEIHADLKKYELCRVDVTSEYGKQVAERFNVKSFPHVAIIDKSGSVILRRLSGELSQQQWEKTLARHADGARTGATRYTVAKPVVESTTTATPAATSSYQVTPSTSSSYSYPTAQPYCASCQRR